MEQKRLKSMDAARGTAMLCVCLSHFAWIYLSKTDATIQKLIIKWIVSVASPAFMIISGLMLGFLYQSQKERWEEIKRKLIGRGLFLLTICHLLMTSAHIAVSGSIVEAFRWGFITDTIGISVIVGSILVDKIKPSGKMILGVSAFLFSWFSILIWNPQSTFLIIFKETLFGSLDRMAYVWNFPILPWFGLYIVGNFIGEKIGTHYLYDGKKKISQILITSAIIFLAMAFVLKLFYKIFIGSENYYSLAYIYQKLPPSPAFFLYYGGAGLFMTYILFKLETIKVISKLLNFTNLLGQTSLFVFILQYYIYFTILHGLNLPYTIFWPLYFITSLIIIGYSCQIWYKKGYNRFIMLNYSGLIKLAASLKVATLTPGK